MNALSECFRAKVSRAALEAILKRQLSLSRCSGQPWVLAGELRLFSLVLNIDVKGELRLNSIRYITATAMCSLGIKSTALSNYKNVN